MNSSAVQPPPWDQRGQEKRATVRRMFSDIAPKYDFANSVMSIRLHHRWRNTAVGLLQLKEGERALDLCCGTGDFLPLLRAGIGSAGDLVGIDFCAPMLERAEVKPGHGATLCLGDACQIPLRNEAVDAVTVGWGIRNVPDIDLAHREIFRVLKPGGRFVSLDTAIPTNPIARIGSGLMLNVLLPMLGTLLGNREAYTYLPKSTEQFKSREALKESMVAAGFSDVRWKDLMMGTICVHFGVKA